MTVNLTLTLTLTLTLILALNPQSPSGLQPSLRILLHEMLDCPVGGLAASHIANKRAFLPIITDTHTPRTHIHTHTNATTITINTSP